MKTTKPKSKRNTINIALLRKIKKRILQRPRQFQMRTYFSAFLDDGSRPSHCGTACCIAGWALVLGKKPLATKPSDAQLIFDDAIDVPHAAYENARLRLGLTGSQADSLFSQYEWPPDFYEQFKSRSPRIRAQVAARRIDYFIKHRK